MPAHGTSGRTSRPVLRGRRRRCLHVHPGVHRSSHRAAGRYRRAPRRNSCLLPGRSHSGPGRPTRQVPVPLFPMVTKISRGTQAAVERPPGRGGIPHCHTRRRPRPRLTTVAELPAAAGLPSLPAARQPGSADGAIVNTCPPGVLPRPPPSPLLVSRGPGAAAPGDGNGSSQTDKPGHSLPPPMNCDASRFTSVHPTGTGAC